MHSAAIHTKERQSRRLGLDGLVGLGGLGCLSRRPVSAITWISCGTAQQRWQTSAKPFFPLPNLEFWKKKILTFDIFVCLGRFTNDWWVPIPVLIMGNCMWILLDPKTVVVSNAFGRHTHKTATVRTVGLGSLVAQEPVKHHVNSMWKHHVNHPVKWPVFVPVKQHVESSCLTGC